MSSTKIKKGMDIYLRFLELIETIQDLPALDPLEQKIFDHIARTLRAEARVSVTDITSASTLGSSVTIHQRLKSLIAKGWIALGDTEDGRRKQVNLTKAAQSHLAKMSKCLMKAARSNDV
ncbi:MarR family transcriptional regulator [Herbaspirillum sp. meg3]|uniref:MarR family transcriptional regulator n=1 Tax=Herbaspirillum sp. meg3 TaxID=2025949 RepID=UPI000B997332|nr:MarR family transcriptional regulator [Herbaspirillum sp. meg3]ASU38539.1 MarR family transcriptional regulator [Herbaspirillum sp. meg3]